MDGAVHPIFQSSKDNNLKENSSKSSTPSGFTNVADDFPPLESIRDKKISKTQGVLTDKSPAKIRDWYSLFPQTLGRRDASVSRVLPDHKPDIINGKKTPVFSSADFISEINFCEKLLVGNFLGNRLSFDKVKDVVLDLWKPKGELKMTIHDEGLFIFEFNTEEDRNAALEFGSFYISQKLFIVRPWHLLLEQSIEEVKSVPIWANLRKIPIHLWNEKGISMIASGLGTPLLADKHTLDRSRMRYARVCVEIEADFEYPDFIPIIIDGVDFKIPVEYSWRPSPCKNCTTFSHTTRKCSRNLANNGKNAKKDGVPRDSKNLQRANDVNTRKIIPVDELEPHKEVNEVSLGFEAAVKRVDRHHFVARGVSCPSRNPNEKANTTSIETNGKPEDCSSGKREDAPRSIGIESVSNEEVNESCMLPCENDLCENGERGVEQEKVLGELFSYKRKKGAGKKKKENHLQTPTVQAVAEGASTSSTDPAIPPGFESHNRFHGLEEEEEEEEEGEVASSNLVWEDSRVSIAKPSSSKPIIGIGMKLSIKPKGTGKLPDGTSRLKKKKLPKSKAPMEVSANKLLEFGSSWGLEFPPQKKNCEKMFSDLAKNHDGLVIEDLDEFANKQ